MEKQTWRHAKTESESLPATLKIRHQREFIFQIFTLKFYSTIEKFSSKPVWKFSYCDLGHDFAIEYLKFLWIYKKVNSFFLSFPPFFWGVWRGSVHVVKIIIKIIKIVFFCIICFDQTEVYLFWYKWIRNFIRKERKKVALLSNQHESAKHNGYCKIYIHFCYPSFINNLQRYILNNTRFWFY